MITRKTFLKRFFGEGLGSKNRTKYQHKKTKKVLIALDFDQSAQKVAEKGFLFAKTMKAGITLLHILKDQKVYLSTEHVTVIGFCRSPPGYQ